MNWLEILFIPVTLLYFLILSALFVYGINFFYLGWAAWKFRKDLQISNNKPLEELPYVTVQLPIFNEWYVAQRLIEAAAQLDYPRELLEIQVLDDSVDETTTLISETVSHLLEQGVNIVHVHRKERKGYKAGALSEGLDQAKGKFVAIFDADFVPIPSFLLKTLPYFDNERVAFVQTRWGHINRESSLLTRLQALSIDSHFAVEQLARSRLGYWFNFNGTAGIWRKEAIYDAGGWQAQTLTEDLDLSYRAFMRGWEARFAPEIEVVAELPVSFTAYRRQQHRWAQGSMECALQYVPQISNLNIPASKKMAAILHLTGYCVHLLMISLSLIYPIIVIISLQYPGLGGLFGIAILFNITALAPTTYFSIAQYSLGRRWFSTLPMIIFMSILGAGMMVNTLRAALQIFTSKQSTFERTPKYGVTRSQKNWDTQRYRVSIDYIVIFEILFALFNIWTMQISWLQHSWLIMIYSSIYAMGLLFTSSFTIIQAFQKQSFTNSEN